MERQQRPRRDAVLAALILLAGVCGLARTVLPQDSAGTKGQQDEVREHPDLLKDLFKGLGDAGGKQTPDQTEELKGLFEGIVKNLGGTGRQQGQSGSGSGCLSQVMLKGLVAGKAATPEQQAKGEALQAHLSDILGEVQRKGWNKVIDLAERALREERDIKEWTLPLSRETYRAQVRSNRATAYQSQTRGDLAANLEAAIGDHSAALREALKAPPEEAACTQELASATHMNLGAAYGQRIREARADNLEKAIGHLEAALSVLTPTASPHQWAATQNNLGAAYADRIRGKRAQNIEQAIDAYGRALTIWRREAFPAQWALLRHNLGAAYRHRVRGDRADNLERALEAFADALTVRSRDMPSGERPKEQSPLDALPAEKPGTDDPLGDLRDIATAYAKLADVLGKAADGPLILLRPDGWASTQNNLGQTYLRRMTGDPADNIEQAIASHRAALTLWTRDAYPVGWAAAKSSLGEAFASRIRGRRADNIELAIAAYGEALTIYTRQAFPRDNLQTAQLLGQALMAKGDWRGALGAFDMARASFRLLFGQGLNEAEARDLIEKAGPLFVEAAYAAAELGDGRLTLALLEEGKARLLAVALKLETLAHSPEERRRLEALRLQVRETEAAYEAARGQEKAARLAALGPLRETLLQLVDNAEARTNSTAGGDILFRAAAVVPKDGALVAPIAVEAGGKLIVVTRDGSGARLAIVGLPEFTRARLGEILGARDRGGWLGAYSINYLDPAEQTRRHGEWLSAIERTGPQLWTLLGRPLVEALTSGGIKPSAGVPVTILPVGPLGLLPLGLAQDPASGRYLMEDYTVAFAPSLTALASARARANAGGGEPSLAAVVNPTGDLPFTILEGALVESRFAPGRRLAVAERAATPQAVVAALKGRDYWHFSSHGYFSWDEPRASGLWLSDRTPLTVGDLIDVRGLGAPRLVVLSACETGLYDIATTPNEFTGLPAAFLQLGAGGVLATLWPVNDLSTALLVARFYDLHRGRGLAPAVALRQAQAWLRSATAQNLRDYVRSAAVDRRIPAVVSESLEQAISEAGRRQEAIGQQRSGSSTSDDGSSFRSPVDADSAPPFAHPYYWSGFTLIGL